jgi:hypothetical protein
LLLRLKYQLFLLSELSIQGGGGDDGGTERSFAERPDLNFGVVVGGDGGIACALEKTERGKSACGLLTREFQQNDKHCA